MVISNYDIAVLNALNELGRRHGLAPFDLDAAIHTPETGPEVIVRFELPPSEALYDRYWKMMTDLGIANPEGPELAGTEKAVWETIQSALRRAPNPLARV